MSDRKIFGYMDLDYPQFLQLLYHQIAQQVNQLYGEKQNDSWSENLKSWVDPEQIYIGILTLIVIIVIFKWLKVLPSNSVTPVASETNNQSVLVYNELPPYFSEINRLVKLNTILQFNPENYNEFYVVSFGADESQNPPLEINEICDPTDDNLEHDEINNMTEFKIILDAIIDQVESTFEKTQRNKLPPHNSESRQHKNGSRIPLLLKR